MFTKTVFVVFFISIIITLSTVLQWSLIQLFKSIFKTHFLERITAVEESFWTQWEEQGEFHPNSTLLEIPTYSIDDILVSKKKINFHLPFLIQNASDSDILSLQTLTSPPLSDLSIDYFSDARKKLLVPDRHDTLAVIMEKILSGGPEKIGTQMIIQTFPFILQNFLNENEKWLKSIFGEDRVGRWKEFGITLTVPVFVSTGFSAKSDDANDITTRTDLHCEPISNVVLQTAGKKKWTLIEPKYSYLLKPTISPDGRAYFFSNIDPLNTTGLSRVPRYEVITKQGDLLHVPTWVWHKVEYLPGVTAVSMSLFEFLIQDFLVNNPVFAVTIIPNLIKEAVGLKTQ